MTKITRAVMVGCGGITQAWLNAIKTMDQVQMVGMVDLFEQAARSRAEQYELSDAMIGTDMATVIEATRPDVVFNCTIPEAHAEVTIRALEMGCHVLSEKPLADSMESARRMVAVADKAQKIFAVIQNRRYNPRMRLVRHLIESGQVGPLTTVDCDFYIGAHFGGFRDHMKHVLLLDMAIHTFDQARMLTGADPVSVYCQEWNPEGSWYDQDASAVAIYEMTGGLVYTYRGSWCAEGMNTSWESAWRLVGQGGTLLWDGEGRIEGQKVAKTGGFFSEWSEIPVPADFDAGTKVGAHGGVIREFIDCVQNGGTPETIATDNIKSLAMVFGAIESAETGRRVRIEI